MKEASGKEHDELLRTIGAAPATRRARGRRRTLVAIAVLALLGAITWLWNSSGDKPAGRYTTEDAVRGNLIVTVSATGTLQPITAVDVGSELSGTIARVLAEENDRVRQGQLLAQLDTAKLADAVTRSRAALASAEAAVQQAQASAAEARATLGRMRHVAQLSGGKVPAPTELESAEAALAKALANESSARAAVTQAQAALKTDETNLGKATIRSPVDGVVLARKVEPGQSVAATMTVPVLFTIAQDLTRMELQVKVDEADVGTVAVGQPASFTVAAWPGRSFPATIRRVGLGSTITDNVVTYKTVLDVRNDDLALRPGMTATASIVTASREDALLVPNAALRYTPPSAGAGKPQASLVSSLLPRLPQQPRKREARPAAAAQRVWVLDAGTPRAVPVTTGVTNGRMTEVLGGELQPGMAVITDYQEAKR